MKQKVVDCVGGVVIDPSGRMLLVLRGNEPGRGLWSIPGGRVEPGESDASATAREILEETGLVVVVGEFLGTVRRDAPDGGVYEIRDYLCTPSKAAVLSEVRAGDDADDVGWFTPSQVRDLSCVPGLVSALSSWGVLPPSA